MKADVNKILTLLRKVKSTGNNTWMACCPAHDDKSPSMTISDYSDNILIHCFSGCTPIDILESIGLDFSDLFPDKNYTEKSTGAVFNAYDVLEALSTETTIVYMTGSKMFDTKKISDADWLRLKVAVQRINAASNLVDNCR